MEQNSDLVSIGKLIDENTYKRENKSILIDETINIDFVKSGAVLHEVKKTKSIEEAGIWQLKYYMYYLKEKGVENIKAEIDFPLIKETKEIILDDSDIFVIKNAINEIEKMNENEKIPNKINSKICKNCAYYDLCYV